MQDEIKPRNQVLVIVEASISVVSQIPGPPGVPTPGKKVGSIQIQGGGAIPPETWETATAKMERGRCVHELLMRVVGELPREVIDKLAEMGQGAYSGEGERRVILPSAVEIGKLKP